MRPSSKRHIIKTITWRFIGTADTILLSWIVSGDFIIAYQIGFFEVISKMILYYFHERFWFSSKILETNKRHIYKTFSWRFLATTDTIILGYIISGNPLIGLKIGFFETLTKMILYYLHEKIWYNLDFGLINRKKNKNSNKIQK